jgi:hypothetical protein
LGGAINENRAKQKMGSFTMRIIRKGPL